MNDNHTEDDCDRCQEDVGKDNLKPVPFLYCDVNDEKHPDMSHLVGLHNKGYRQYYVCTGCLR